MIMQLTAVDPKRSTEKDEIICHNTSVLFRDLTLCSDGCVN